MSDASRRVPACLYCIFLVGWMACFQGVTHHAASLTCTALHTCCCQCAMHEDQEVTIGQAIVQADSVEGNNWGGRGGGTVGDVSTVIMHILELLSDMISDKLGHFHSQILREKTRRYPVPMSKSHATAA